MATAATHIYIPSSSSATSSSSAAAALPHRAGLFPHYMKWKIGGRNPKHSITVVGSVSSSTSSSSSSSEMRAFAAASDEVVVKASIEFIKGIRELTVPDVSLTRSRDGKNGQATFVFNEPSVFDSSREIGDITGLYLIDEEGVLQSVDVSAKFVNGRPAKIEAKYSMKNVNEWDRFMRFMERYAAINGLGFVKK